MGHFGYESIGGQQEHLRSLREDRGKRFRVKERSAMDWMLTEEELQGYKSWLHDDDVLRAAQAQAKKLVEYYEGRCEHKPPAINVSRWFCPECRREIRRQVGLECYRLIRWGRLFFNCGWLMVDISMANRNGLRFSLRFRLLGHDE